RLLDPTVEVHRSDERLVTVGEQRLLAAATGLLLASAEQQLISKIEALRLPRQSRRRDERCLRLRFLAFVELVEFVKQQVRDDEAEDGIAQELQRLVVAHAAAHVLVGT